MTYELRPVASAADWAALHAIRQATLFTIERRGPDVRYDDHHPDDRTVGKQPFVLMRDGEPIGVVRLDRRGDEGGVVRLVGIVPARQRQGHGRALDGLVAVEARRRGMRHLALNAHPSAVGFYEKTGWQEEVWDAAELVGFAADCVQMVKAL